MNDLIEESCEEREREFEMWPPNKKDEGPCGFPVVLEPPFVRERFVTICRVRRLKSRHGRCVDPRHWPEKEDE